MDWICPICGKTFKRTNQGHKCYSGGSPELAFPGKKAKCLPLYFALLDRVKAQVPFTCDYPPSGGVLWRKRSNFASMHGESSGLYVNFHSNQHLYDVDPITVAPISANRLLHIVCVKDLEQIPALANCIVASYVLTEQAGPVQGIGKAE